MRLGCHRPGASTYHSPLLTTRHLPLTAYHHTTPHSPLPTHHSLPAAHIGQALVDGPGGTVTCSQCGEAGVRVDEVIPNRQLREVPPRPPTRTV